MAITDFPWFKIYAAETLSDENFASWGLAERGAWFTLLCHCWKEGSIPSDLTRLARLCSCNADAMHDIWLGIADRFHEQPGTGRMVCLRLEFERQKSLEESEGKSQHGKKAANARWGKYKTDMLGQCSGNAQPMPDDAHQPQPQPNKEQERPQAAPVPRVKKEKVVKVKTTELKPESVEAFQVAWEFVPKTFRKWDQEARDYVQEPVAKGSRLIAERNFQRIVDAGVATPADLCFALQAYVLEGEMPKKGFFQHVSTFFGPEKSTYLEWLDRSRQVQKEMA